MKGHCLCGKTAWEVQGEASWAGYCHCDDCRRNCGAPVVAWLGVSLQHFRWIADEPKYFKSSEGVLRHFCETCGSPMGFEAKRFPDEIHLYAASLENPEQYQPSFHVFHGRKLSWLDLHDNLPKHAGTLTPSNE